MKNIFTGILKSFLKVFLVISSLFPMTFLLLEKSFVFGFSEWRTMFTSIKDIFFVLFNKSGSLAKKKRFLY